MPYRGRLQTSLFNDRQIRAKEFAKWRHCHSAFRHGKRRDIVDDYKTQISNTRELLQPIWLDVDDRQGHVYIGDGHHRAVALIELGVTAFPFHWRLISKGGWFTQPPLEWDAFPYSLLDVVAT